MKKIILLAALSFFLYRCSSDQAPLTDANEPVSKGLTIKHLHWLAGTWQFNSSDGTFFEIWKKENDSLLTGNGYFIKGKDTLFSEKLELQQKGSDLFYVATVPDQNNGQPVPFRFMEFNKGEYNFVNTEHDFPQRIIYKNPQPDFLCVRIEGTQQGKLRKEDFNFLKVAK
ncbi:MAG: hypothetical protein K0S12_1053 [Bacteroidetes bacterium]|jgi:hypothetical protein|nr:hypothetical protein [Bacteroidota bacterium]